jgi:lipoprotein-anchoring transpeptidase ErfK/SrfK
MTVPEQDSEQPAAEATGEVPAVLEVGGEAQVPQRFSRVRAVGRKLLPSRRVSLWLLGILGALVMIASTGAAYATYDFGNRYAGRILPGATVYGIDVGGLVYEDALALVRGKVRNELRREIALRWKGRTWKATLKEMGARNDARRVVRAALDASANSSFFAKMRMRVLGQTAWFRRPVAISFPKKRLRAYVEGLASVFNREARDATVDYSSGWVEVVPEKNGRLLQVRPTYRLLRAALRRGSPVAPLAVKVDKPEVKTDAFRQVLLLRIGENKLYLYEDGKITHEWLVATGQPEYPTPTGIYEITEKRYMPTWVNPDPTGWGASMPLSIPPGPSNPLGLRALNWSAEAIRFHGTSATYSLGYNASHGCIRMSNDDVIQLYDMIDVGTPIVSTVVASLKPLYVSAPDPTVVAADSGSGEPATDEQESGAQSDAAGDGGKSQGDAQNDGGNDRGKDRKGN